LGFLLGRGKSCRAYCLAAEWLVVVGGRGECWGEWWVGGVVVRLWECASLAWEGSGGTPGWSGGALPVVRAAGGGLAEGV